MRATRLIELQREGLFASVDAEDFDYVRLFPWRLVRTGPYTLAVMTRIPSGTTRSGFTSLYLHRFILDAPRGVLVDHRDGDVLNNVRSNLRLANATQSSRNARRKSSSKLPYKGIRRNGSRWSAFIRCKPKRLYLGNFETPEEAARAYDRAARRLHGEFACVNFPRTGERGAV